MLTLCKFRPSTNSARFIALRPRPQTTTRADPPSWRSLTMDVPRPAKRPFSFVDEMVYSDLLIDAMHYAQILSDGPNCRQHKRRGRKKSTTADATSRIAPSLMRAIALAAKDRLLDSELMVQPCIVPPQFMTRLTDMHTSFSAALAQAHAGRGQMLAWSTIATVDWDNTQLWYGREGIPLCSARTACVALNLTMNQGPLHAFLLPGQPPSTGSLCLLCTRLHAQLLNESVDIVDSESTSPLLLPPTNNLVDCAGGYHRWALGVDQNNCRAFSRICCIAGSSNELVVKYSPQKQQWWVDQSKLVYVPPLAERLDFRQGPADQTSTPSRAACRASSNQTA
jgi:hypothetical protein